jgi:hypothetical protein
VSRPDIACLCVGQQIHAALTVTGEHRDRLLERFRQAHTGPGHVPEVPPRDWYRKERQITALLGKLRAEAAA